MYIQLLEVENFKGWHGRREFKFHEGVNLVEGFNGQGKTSIADAVTWALWGTDRDGSNPKETFLNQRSRVVTVRVVLQEGSRQWTVTRIKKEGSTSKVYLNDQPVTQNEITAMLDWPVADSEKKDWWVSAWTPESFWLRSPQASRTLVTSVVPTPTDDELVAVMGDVVRPVIQAANLVGAWDEALKQWRAQHRALETTASKIEGGLVALKETLANLDPATTSAGETIEWTDEQEQKWHRGQALLTGVFAEQEELDRVRTLTRDLQLAIQRDQQQLATLHADVRLKAGSPCPVCEQPLTDSTYQSLASHFETERAVVTQQMAEREAQMTQLTASLTSLDEAFQLWQQKRKSATLWLQKFSPIRDQWMKRQSTDHGQQIHQTQEKIRELDTQLERTNREATQLKDRLEWLKDLRVQRMKMFEDRVNAGFQTLKLQLTEVSKTTKEDRAVFEVWLKNRPFVVCSNSERLRASLDFNQWIRRHVANLPVFLDNGESVQQWDPWPLGTQIFVARVEECPLKVTLLETETPQAAMAD